MAELKIECSTTAAGSSGVTSLNSLTGVISIEGAGEVTVSTVGQIITVSGSPHTGGSGGGTVSAALIGVDGITIISGSNTTTVSGFRTEFVAASGSLQSQIDAVEGSDVDSITVTGTAFTGDVTLSGIGGVTVLGDSQLVTISGLSLAELENLKAYGELYEENDAGSAYVFSAGQGGTYKQWTTSVVGQVSTELTVSGSSTSDNLTILENGAGEYLVCHSAAAHAAATNNVWTFSIFRNGVRVPGTDAQKNFSNSLRRATFANTSIIRLDPDDVVDLRIRSANSNRTLTVFRANLSIARIGRTGIGSGEGGVTDHGDLTGLADDDHALYSRVDGVRPFTSTVGGVTPTLASHLTTKGYVDFAVSGTIVAVSGSFSESLTVSGQPVTIGGAVGDFVEVAGDTMTGNLTISKSFPTLAFTDDDTSWSLFTTGVSSPFNSAFAFRDNGEAAINRIVVVSGIKTLGSAITKGQLTLGQDGNVFIKPGVAEGPIPVPDYPLHVGGTGFFDGGDVRAVKLGSAGGTISGSNGIIDDELVATSGTFSDSLTISGVPVATGTSGSGLNNIVEDLTPQLGGDLDANDFDIFSNPGTILAISGGDDLYLQAGEGVFTDTEGTIAFDSGGLMTFTAGGNVVLGAQGFAAFSGAAALNFTSSAGSIVFASNSTTLFHPGDASLVGLPTVTMSGGVIPSRGIGVRGGVTVTGTVHANRGRFDKLDNIEASGFSPAEFILVESNLKFKNVNDTRLLGGQIYEFMTIPPTVVVSGEGFNLNILVGFNHQGKTNINSAQVFTGSAAFRASNFLQETGAITSPHTLFHHMGFQGAPEYNISHNSTSTAAVPLLASFDATPVAHRVSGFTGNTTITLMTGFSTNSINPLRTFFGERQINPGITVNKYAHFIAHSNVTNGLQNTGGVIVEEVGLDLQNIGVGTNNVSVRSTATAASMRHAGPGIFGANRAPQAAYALEVQGNLGVTGNIVASGTSGQITMGSGIVQSRLKIPVYTTDPSSPLDGDVWINSTTTEFSYRIGGTTLRVTGV